MSPRGQVDGVFLPLRPQELARVWARIEGAGFSPDGEGLRAFLLSPPAAPSSAPSLLDRAFQFVERHPDVLRDAGQVARVALGGRAPRRT